MSKLIPATLGYSAIVDDADFDRLIQYRWYAHNCGGKGPNEKRPARRTSVTEGRKVLFLVHHIVRAPIGFVVDHINGDPWDNRRENLRICTHTQNIRNQRRKREMAKGVYLIGKRYSAKISADRESYHLGWYETEEDAALAYDAAALYLHGEFANLNYPDRQTKPLSPEAVSQSWTPIRRRNEKTAEVLELLRTGLLARQVALATGVCHASVCRIAKENGLNRPRGRPRLAA